LWNWKRTVIVLAALLYFSIYLYLLSTRTIVGEAQIWLGLLNAVGPGALVAEVFAACSTNGRLRSFLVWPGQYKVFDEVHPTYRFVDYFRALERYAALAGRAGRLEHQHPKNNLLGLLQTVSLAPPPAATQNKICTGYEQHGFFATEIYWLLEGPAAL